MSELEDERFYEAHADFCSVCSNANRLKILDVLKDGEQYSVSDIERLTGISQSTVSQHLKLMRDRGMVVRERDGVNNYYSVADERIVEGVETIREVVREQVER
ncbi:ArsR/SmtB family transcription factor [Halapricum hydrolyticum]|uniref:Metalloregulator ArsR/SmtB family transcription factor n=1 Tax=Halapricum hydrolyticum TaxID=2979991 RepID=A0AAE3LDV8_9EURY|nr:metalloregulator ArsR/SmtB family transcription factor [Halapricum hydrolyticum]MCU4716739.1 metalloregulator ArsR/SmtB family transcription factor [Halapricum hydrolyticum]MCU4725656.1 metalloregulator ArsR/SmtB family transcription factor [Halapricum hydrolyticum]